MKKLNVIILFLVLLFASCSKKVGMTTSKIKLFGSNAFSTGSTLETLANNGLILYGTSTDGKSFSKRIDNDSVDLVFPNGTWNFFAVAWEQSSATSPFQGKTRCAKQLGVNLTGSDTTITLNLNNANCIDTAFSAYSYDSGSQVFLPRHDFIGCVNHQAATSYTDTASCTLEDKKTNKGYATSYRVYMPQYKNFGNGVEEYNDAFISACATLDPATSISVPNSASQTLMNSLSFPDPSNGVGMVLRLYYSQNACDDSTGFDDVVIGSGATPRTKNFVYQTGQATVRSFYSTPEVEICKGNRLTVANKYAGGVGTQYSPYYICTPEQFNNISNYFGSGSDTSSFMLVSDLDFMFGTFSPIGHPVDATNAIETLPYSGYFYGNDHRLSNFFIKNSNSITSGQYIGVFRYIQLPGTTPQISNLKINRVAVVGFEKFSNVGLLAGADFGSPIYNVAAFGHAEGSGIVGGMIGTVDTSPGQVTLERVVGELDVKAKIDKVDGVNLGAGGLVGYATGSSGLTIKDSAVKPIVNASGENEYYVDVPFALYSSVSTGSGYCVVASCPTANVQVKNKLVVNGSYWLQLTGDTQLAITNMYNIASGTSLGTATPVKLSGVGGLIGLSQIAGNTITNTVVKAAEIEGAQNVGGVFGEIDTTGTISNVKFEGVISDRQWGIASGTVGAGGLVGKGNANLTIQKSFVVGALDGDTSDAVSRGAIIGTRNSSVISGVYHTMASPNGEGSTTSATSQSTLNTKSVLTSLSFINYIGSGDPTSSFTGTPTSGDLYFDSSSGLCYSYSTAWSLASSGTGACTNPWFMHADTYDMPKLIVEYLLESQYPFVASACRDTTFYQSTPKNATDGGRIFCKLSQISTTASTVQDHLGQSLYFIDTGSSMTSFPAGVYKLNGHGFNLYNYNNTVGNGVFTELSLGSYLSNLGIRKVVVNNTSENKSYFGAIANKNYGTLDNLVLKNISLDIDSSILYPSEFSSTVGIASIGGLVGFNAGVITNGEFNGSLYIHGDGNGTYTTPGNMIVAGGVIGSGAPSSVYSRNQAHVSFERYAPTGVMTTTYDFHGGLLGHTNGSIVKEISGEISLSLKSGGSAISALFGPVVGHSNGTTTIKDIALNLSVGLGNASLNSAPTIAFGTGSFDISRILYRIDNTAIANMFTTLPSLGSVADVVVYTQNVPTVDNLLYGLTFGFDGSGNPTITGTNYAGGSNLSVTQLFSGWNYSTSFVQSMGTSSSYVWRIDPLMGGEMELVHASGDFDRIGKGF